VKTKIKAKQLQSRLDRDEPWYNSMVSSINYANQEYVDRMSKRVQDLRKEIQEYGLA